MNTHTYIHTKHFLQALAFCLLSVNFSTKTADNPSNNWQKKAQNYGVTLAFGTACVGLYLGGKYLDRRIDEAFKPIELIFEEQNLKNQMLQTSMQKFELFENKKKIYCDKNNEDYNAQICENLKKAMEQETFVFE